MVLLSSGHIKKRTKKLMLGYTLFDSDEEPMFMYDCHPQPSHQLPFDQGFLTVISPSSVVHAPELFCIDRNAVGCYDFVQIYVRNLPLCNGAKLR